MAPTLLDQLGARFTEDDSLLPFAENVTHLAGLPTVQAALHNSRAHIQEI